MKPTLLILLLSLSALPAFAIMDTFNEESYGLSISRKGNWVFIQDISAELKKRLRTATTDLTIKNRNPLVTEMVIEPGNPQEPWFPSLRLEKVLIPTNVSPASLSTLQLTMMMLAQTGKSDPSFVMLKAPELITLAGRETGFAEFEVTVYPTQKTKTDPTVMHFRMWFIPVENGWLRLAIAAPKPQWDQVVKSAEEMVQTIKFGKPLTGHQNVAPAAPVAPAPKGSDILEGLNF